MRQLGVDLRRGLAGAGAAVSGAARAFGRGARQLAVGILRGIARGVAVLASALWTVLNAFFQNIIAPFAVTAANLLGYFVDKIFFGAKTLRPYTVGPFPNDTPIPIARSAGRERYGWNPYERMPSGVDNALGFFLGAGFGVLGYANLLAISSYRAFAASYNLLGYAALGKNSSLWGQHEAEAAAVADPCHPAVRVLFALPLFPLWFVPALITNTADFLVTLVKHNSISLGLVVANNAHLLGENGVFGKTIAVEDKRHGFLKWGLGFPGVLVGSFISVFTNLTDLAFTLLKHNFISLGFTVGNNWHFLGKEGVFGENKTTPDNRHWAFKWMLGAPGVFFGALICGFTNLSDLIFTVASHNLSSFGFTVVNNWHLLGKEGVFGESITTPDNRHWALKWILGFPGFFFGVFVSGLSNLSDVIFTFASHNISSFGSTLASNWHLLGKEGVFGESKIAPDNRHWALKWILGFPGFFLGAFISGLSNLSDVILSFVSHNISSFGFTVANNWHLLGKEGVFDESKTIVDNRHWALKWGVGSLGFVFAALPNSLTNAVDFGLTAAWYSWESIRLNFLVNANWLSQSGAFGTAYQWKDLDDKRKPMAARILTGLTLPVWGTAVLLTNALDFGITGTKHFALNFTEAAKWCFGHSYSVLSQSGFSVVFKSQVLAPVVAMLATDVVVNPLSAGAASMPAPSAPPVDSDDPMPADSAHKALTAPPQVLEEGDVDPTQKAVIVKETTPSQKILFGFFSVLSFPVWGTAALVSNLFDFSVSVPAQVIYQAALSVRSLLRNNYNILLNALVGPGLLGPNRANDDQRPRRQRILFAVLTVELWFPVIFLTNLADVLLTSVWGISSNLGLSFYHIAKANYNSLGHYGVLGEKAAYNDPRPTWVQVFSGIIPALILIPILAGTNLLDALASFTRYVGVNLYKSSLSNFKSFYRWPANRESVLWGNLPDSVLANTAEATSVSLDSDAPEARLDLTKKVDEPAVEEDPSAAKPRSRRELIEAVAFGFVSAPLWLTTVILLNGLDANLVFIKHFSYNVWKSFTHIMSFYNYVLGSYGLMGERTRSVDARPWYVKLFFALPTLPITLAVVPVLNAVDIAGSSVKYVGINLAESLTDIWKNYASVLAYADGSMLFPSRKALPVAAPKESGAEQVILPPSAPPSAVALMVASSVPSTVVFDKADGDDPVVYSALAGAPGMLDPKPDAPKNNGVFVGLDRFAKTGIWTLSFLAFLPVLVLTNAFDLSVAVFYHSYLSFSTHVANYWNVFGEAGVFGKKTLQEDKRHVALRFGPTALVGVGLGLLVTVPLNTLNFMATSMWHIGQSYYENFLSIANLMGSYGVFGARHAYKDDRALGIKLAAGFFSVPVVIPALLSNAVDLLASFVKHNCISLYAHVGNYWNLFGEAGVFGKKTVIEDKRHVALRFGPTAWLGVGFGLLLIVPLNVLNFLLTASWHVGKSCYENYLSIANLLGDNGFFGPRHVYEDARPLLIKVLAGIPSALVIIPAVISNLADLLLTAAKHTGTALISKWFWRDVVFTAAALVTSPIWWTALFYARKVVRSLVNVLLRPFVDLAYGRGFNASRWLGSLLVVGSLGVFSVIKLIFKWVTGYSSRFGFERAVAVQANQAADIDYAEARTVFRTAIDLAKKGKALSGVADSSDETFRRYLRPVGLRSSEERISKKLHNAYEAFADKKPVNKQAFFSSQQYVAAKQSLTEDFEGYKGDKDLLGEMETYFKAQFGIVRSE